MEPSDEVPALSLPTSHAEDHREVTAALGDVERALKRPDRGQRKVGQQLERLSELVESHFAREESGGYMAEALARAPRLTSTAEKLLAEHTNLLDDAQKLHILARSGIESKGWWRQIETDFTSLKARLVVHEHAENRLLQEAYSRDIGVKD